MKRIILAILAVVTVFRFSMAQDSIPAITADKAAGESYAAERISHLDQQESGKDNMRKTKVLDGHIEYSANSASATVSDSEGETVTIYNLSGKAVIEKKIDSDSIEISLSGLSKGVYLVRLGARTAKIVL